MTKTKRVAVLGSGIMGSSTALLLADSGFDVTVYDMAARPFSAASCWNEGKIHLGFLYSADPSLNTAREVIPGGLAFKPLVEKMTGCSLANATTRTEDTYLCHRDSVVSPDAMWDYAKRVAKLVSERPDAAQYLVDVSECRVEKLSAREFGQLTDSPDLLSGIRVPEHSVATTWVADRFIDALAAQPQIELCMNTRVEAVAPLSANDLQSSWRVQTGAGLSDSYDFVVNALWEGRLAVDRSAGLTTSFGWSNRYRMSVFLRTAYDVDAPSAVIATGPFGDIKNYNNRDFYLSWYPAGLLVESSELLAPPPPEMDAALESEIVSSIISELSSFFPAVADIKAAIANIELRGGWVFAVGRGNLSDPNSTLHCRDNFGIRRSGCYLSVDTGKYSSAPWLASRVVDTIAGYRQVNSPK
ncbi:FAD-binding oxidoreductase [Halioglobus sp.]|nr:FAD-binding oxidoreductase [Halioglobus sp.]